MGIIVRPEIRGFLCLTAHPAGCTSAVREQIAAVKRGGTLPGPRRALVIGASTGYGLASRIAAAFGCGARTVGVFMERPASAQRTATAGWYNTAAFEAAARGEGLGAWSVNGDAFSAAVKERTLETVRNNLGQADLVVYSLAAPRRTDPATGRSFTSVLKPLGGPYTNKTVDVQKGTVSVITVEPAGEEETRQTVAVMGGEDWELWLRALRQEDLLAKGAVTVAYSYIGSQITRPIYRDGTIGRAKKHLERTARLLDGELAGLGGGAYVSVNKALVTQASSAIPFVPLYISLLFKAMKARGTHEGCIEQICRLFRDRLFGPGPVPVDSERLIRLDDWELDPEVQREVKAGWLRVTTETLEREADIAGYRLDFLKLFGFGLEGVDYEAEVEQAVPIPSLAPA